jgi:hypothetical protein
VKQEEAVSFRGVLVALTLFGIAASVVAMASGEIGKAQSDVVLEPDGGGSKQLTVRVGNETTPAKGAPGTLRIDVAMYQYVIRCDKDGDDKVEEYWTSVEIDKGGGEFAWIEKDHTKHTLSFYTLKDDVITSIGMYCDYSKGACQGAGLPAEFWGKYEKITVYRRPGKEVCFPDDQPQDIELKFQKKWDN